MTTASIPIQSNFSVITSIQADEANINNLSSANPNITSSVINVKTFGAKGDGVTNDTSVIQSAINTCRINNLVLYFPVGKYIVSSLDFGNWMNFSIYGDGPGSAGVGGSTGLTILASTLAHVSVAFDFSGSSYGTVSGIAFTTDPTVNACILLARTTGNTVSNYGSDIAFNNCNFSIPNGTLSRACIISQCAEVITFNDCRFQYGGVPAFVFTTRASSYWGVTSSLYTAISSNFTVTMIRFFGGEITGNNSMAIVLDSFDVATGADITISGVYGAISGSNTYFLQVLSGSWSDLFIQCRVEVTNFVSNYGGIELVGSSAISNSTIQMNTTAGYFMVGSGTVSSSSLTCTAPIVMTAGALQSVTIYSTIEANVTCPTLKNCKIMTANYNGINALTASNVLEVDDGNGGMIVYFNQLSSAGSNTFHFPTTGVTTGLYVFTYSGSSVAIWYSLTQGTPTGVKIWDATAAGIGVLSVGALTTGNQSTFTVTSTYNGNGDNFIVRRYNTTLFGN